MIAAYKLLVGFFLVSFCFIMLFFVFEIISKVLDYIRIRGFDFVYEFALIFFMLGLLLGTCFFVGHVIFGGL